MSRESDQFVLQTRLFVIMRRELARVIDLEYLRRNREYATEIMTLAEDSADPDLVDVARKLRKIMELPAHPTAKRVAEEVELAPPPMAKVIPLPPQDAPAAIPVQKTYVGSLR